jgi:hypothetical protein
MAVVFGEFSLDRMERAVEKVRQRLHRATGALEAAGVPYAVAGGNAVALWVSRVDESAVRNTQDVDLIVRRPDFDAVKQALEQAGFIYRHVGGLDAFLDGPGAKPRDAVHVIFAQEKVRPEDIAENPDVAQSESAGAYRVLNIEALVRIKLIAFRDKDRTHLRDLIDVGIIDATWPQRFPPELGSRLQALLDTPNG